MTNQHADYDPLSEFPDDILIVIISSLTLKEAGRTSVLSSRWTNLWKHTPCLIFKDQRALDRIRNNYMLTEATEAERQNYVKWLNRILQLSKAPSLKEFSVCFDLIGYSCHRYIKMWLGHAFSHHVEKLELAILRAIGGTYYPSYGFPKKLLSHSSVQHKYDFKPLKALSLKGVNVYDKDVEFFLNNSPLLEQMVIWYSDSLVKLEFSGPSLKLKILELHHCDKLQSVTVRNTNRSSFSVASSLTHPTLLLETLLSLADVSIVFSYPRISISQVSSLLSTSPFQLETLKVLIEDPEKITSLLEFPKLTKLKKLVLGFTHPKNIEHLIGVIHLLRVAPFLKEFALELIWGGCYAPGPKWFVPGEEINLVEICPPQFLKVVKISGFFARTSEFTFLRYFVKYAISLETIIVDLPKNICRSDDQTESLRALVEQFEGELPQHIQLVLRKRIHN